MWTEYGWKIRRFRGDPTGVANELKTLGKEIKPEQMVEYARTHPESELHKCYTWDDTKAAEKWRKQESRLIIDNLVVIQYHDEEKKSEPVKVRIMYRTEEKPSAGYVHIGTIMSEEERYKGLLKVAKAELERFRDKYRALSNKDTRNIIIDVFGSEFAD